MRAFPVRSLHPDRRRRRSRRPRLHQPGETRRSGTTSARRAYISITALPPLKNGSDPVAPDKVPSLPAQRRLSCSATWSGNGDIWYPNAILVDDGENGGGVDPKAVSYMNGCRMPTPGDCTASVVTDVHQPRHPVKRLYRRSRRTAGLTMSSAFRGAIRKSEIFCETGGGLDARRSAAFPWMSPTPTKVQWTKVPLRPILRRSRSGARASRCRATGRCAPRPIPSPAGPSRSRHQTDRKPITS